tara:strand:- start:287 stop:772 length:486 start_codon:yes stop_codon:yes gene_type:complete
MSNDNIALKLNIEDYLPSKSTNNQFLQRRTHKMGGGAGAAAMHFVGMSMLGGMVIGSVVKSVNAPNSVKEDCDKIQELGEDVHGIVVFMATEVQKRQQIAKMITSQDNFIQRRIADFSEKIDEEEERQKEMYKFTQLTNLVVVGSFILVIISKIIVARNNL